MERQRLVPGRQALGAAGVLSLMSEHLAGTHLHSRRRKWRWQRKFNVRGRSWATSRIRAYVMEIMHTKLQSIIGPDGALMTVTDLPSPTTTRWVIMRKAKIVTAVRGGLLSLDEACNRYVLSPDEFLRWEALVDQHGLAGLRTTRTQQYRRSY